MEVGGLRLALSSMTSAGHQSGSIGLRGISAEKRRDKQNELKHNGEFYILF